MQLPWSRTRMDEIYAHLAIRVFATSMIGIFVPIYLYTIEFSLSDIALFMSVMYTFTFLLAPFSAILSRKMGCARQMILLAPFQGFYYLLLLSIPYQRELFVFAAAVSGIATAIYWIPLNAIIVNSMSKRREGKQIANIMALPRMIALFAPFAAGIILTSVGFSAFFALAIILIGISVWPLLLSPDMRFRCEFRLSLPKNICIQQALVGIIDISESVVWPIWLFSQFHNLVDVGIAASLQGVGVLTFTAILGGVSDHHSRKRLLRLAGIAYAAVWFGRMMFSDMSSIFALSFFGGVAITLLESTVFPLFADNARGKDLFGKFVYREGCLFVGRAMALIVLWYVASPSVSFLFVGLASLVLLVI